MTYEQGLNAMARFREEEKSRIGIAKWQLAKDEVIGELDEDLENGYVTPEEYEAERLRRIAALYKSLEKQSTAKITPTAKSNINQQDDFTFVNSTEADPNIYATNNKTGHRFSLTSKAVLERNAPEENFHFRLRLPVLENKTNEDMLSGTSAKDFNEQYRKASDKLGIDYHVYDSHLGDLNLTKVTDSTVAPLDVRKYALYKNDLDYLMPTEGIDEKERKKVIDAMNIVNGYVNSSNSTPGFETFTQMKTLNDEPLRATLLEAMR